MLSEIINNGYCVGCGACACGDKPKYKMDFTDKGAYLPIMISDKNETNMEICPFSSQSLDENQISKQMFHAIVNMQYSAETGYYLKNFAGYAQAGNYRRNGSSGGMVSWLLGKLIEINEVDYVIHVKSSNTGIKTLFEYQISNSVEELKTGAKSKYYPVEMSQVMNHVIMNPGRYAFVGLPCFVKALRLLAMKNPAIKERIKYAIALVCGHMKTDRFSKAMAWEMGIHPDSLFAFDFRVKHEGLKASDYGVEAKGKHKGEIVTRNELTRNLFCSDWKHGFFKLNACDYCDDVIGETSDASIGDAWLPEYEGDPMGTNILTVRKIELIDILRKYSTELYLEEICIEKIIQSQAGGFRHRREGLGYRLFLKDLHGQYRPKKRVAASADLSKKRKKIYELRLQMTEASNQAYSIAIERNDFSLIEQTLQNKIMEYDKLNTVGWSQKAKDSLKRRIMGNKRLRKVFNLIFSRCAV